MLETIDYHADDVRLTGYLADGSGGVPAPGILVAHEAPGLGGQVKERARRLAGLGYVAFALDMYGEVDLPLETAGERHMALMTTPGLMFRRALAALDTLAVQPNVDGERLAAIGFCQGGIVALELARGGAPIRCAVGFHPGLKRPAGSADGPIAAKVLMMIGDSDPIVPQENRTAFAAEMEAKGADWQLHVFGTTGHSFTNPAVDAMGFPGFRYNPQSDRRAWAMMLALFQEELGIRSS